MERLWPHSPAPLRRSSAGIGLSWFLGLDALGVATVGFIPRSLPAGHVPNPDLVEQLLPGALGIALMSFTETIAAGRAFAPARIRRSRPIASFLRSAPPTLPAHFSAPCPPAADFANGCRAGRRRTDAESVTLHRPCFGRHDARARPAARTVAPGRACGDRDRLFGGTDRAGGIRLDPQHPPDGISLGAGGFPWRAGVRHSAGYCRGDCPLPD